MDARSLDQQQPSDALSPNHSNYSNLTNSSSSSASSPAAAHSASTPTPTCSLSSSSPSSAPQYSEDLLRRGSKSRELDVGEEERDSYSPVASPVPNGEAAATSASGNGSGGDNKIKLKPPSKEEKQRQNEEIVCMETSTISTETGSWESVYPTTTTAIIAATVEPVEKQPAVEVGVEVGGAMRERTYSSGGAGSGVTADTSSLFKGISASSLLREFEKREREQPLSTSGHSACFIDASSLRDEDEVLSFPSLDGAHELKEAAEEQAEAAEEEEQQEEEEASPTKQLEEFHKAFARCKSKPEAAYSSSNSNSGAESPQKEELELELELESANNLSDEEKLWKREQQLPSSSKEDATEASVSLAADADSSDSSLSVKMRPAPARPIPYSFQHNAQHFSVHPLGSSPKFAALNGHSHGHGQSHAQSHAQGHADLSYTTDYSSSSPAPSLVWSEQEPPQQRMPHRQLAQPHQHPQLSTETPHNSMVHIEPSMSSNNSSIHRDYTLSSSLSHHRDSGAYCSDATDSPLPLPRTPKRSSKFDEANPIVSGGASIEDFQLKQCESPSIKRRTDTCPIVSGGFVSLDFAATQPLRDEEEEAAALALEVEQVELRKPLSGIASWVVDMSDCRPERRKSTSSNSSLEATRANFRERSDSNGSHKSGCGFYVSLDDMDKKPAEQPLSKSYTAPKAANFFVQLSQSEVRDKELELAKDLDKKNIFSMFIDFNEGKAAQRNGNGNGNGNGRKEPFNLAQRLSSSLTSAQRRAEDALLKSSASSTETLMAKSQSHKKQEEAEEAEQQSRSLDYQSQLEPPLTVAALRRMSLEQKQQQQQQQQRDASKRHSWGSQQSGGGAADGSDYKRSISLTANGEGLENGRGAGLMSIIDKLPIISKASSLSVDSSLSPYEDYSGSKSGLSSEEELVQPPVARLKRRRRDVQINETFDKSSVASITEGILSKDMSPASTTDTDDLTFQQDEELALREVATSATLQLSSSASRVMETIIEAKETASPKKTSSNSNSNSNLSNSNGHTMESLHATIEKQKQLLETVNEQAEAATFVKLSDMDKPKQDSISSPDAMSKSAGNNHRSSAQLMNRLYREERDPKARPHSWAMTRSTGNNNNNNSNGGFQNFTNSVDNLRSLSRLFPNFSKEFSNSLPNDMALEQTQEYVQLELSAESSLASSFSRSGMDESSISCRQPRRLGEDLLKMFLQEIATDMVVEVHGRRIRAHKCILRSRCQYFAAMLAGHGAQSVVSLQGYSYSAVHFALCHIYSGASHPPDGISLMELAALADLLGLEGLKEVTSHALKTNYCHNFHKPCSGCIDGILQVLPVALNHALDDLYRKCLRWTCRHYLKVWPTRQFAQLPPDILGRCRQQIVAYLTSETVLDTVLDCDHLRAQLSSHRWGHVCEHLVADILDAAYGYVGDHFASLIASDAFLSLGHDRSRHIPRLESVLLHTASSLTADQACRSYQRVTRLNTVLQAKVIQMPVNLGELAKELQGLQEEQLDWDPEYMRLVSALLSAVEQCLIRQCSRAMRVTAWQRMDLDLRKKIQTLARLTEPLDLKRNSGKSAAVGKACSFGGNTRNQDLVQIRLAIQAQSRRALAQETQLYKATQTQDNGAGANVQTTERGVQANHHDPRDGNGGKLLKSNSRAYVPQPHRASSQASSERNSLNLHRRTQSEAPPFSQQKRPEAKPVAQSVAPAKTAASAPAPVRLAEVRPRYLEPRKARAVTQSNNAGPLRSATSGNIPGGGGAKAKGLHISSSDSSRNSSPAAARRMANKSNTNMSMESLASPARRAKSAPRAIRAVATKAATATMVDNEHRYGSELSLAESMKSSVITNKTISHESLQSCPSGSGKMARLQQLNSRNRQGQGPTNPVVNGTAPQSNGLAKQRSSALANKSTRQLRQQNASNGSSPSSVHTTKSAASRLSSVSSTLSTRGGELFKQRSISVPAGGDNAPSKGRHSFLSAKSREILAKRAEKNKLQQQQQQQQQEKGKEKGSEEQRLPSGPLRSASHSAVTTMMLQQHNLRNSLPSNIPTRRPNTLLLKKTTTSVANGRPMVANGIMNGVHNKAAQAVKQKLELLIDAKLEEPMQRVESKLERSSTFCKESGDLDLDLDIGELQIVE